MSGFDITPETMRKSAEEIDAGKDEVQVLLDQFNAKLQEYADAFGGDEIGSLLGIAHQACSDALNECFTANIEDLTAYSTNLREMADGHDLDDEEIAKGFEELGGFIPAATAK